MRKFSSTTSLLLGAAALSLSACGNDEAKEPVEMKKPAVEKPSMEVTREEASDMSDDNVSVADILGDVERRGEAAVARDVFRHPAETLEFFGIDRDMTVVEIWPGAGWYTDIIAAFLGTGSGTLYAAHFEPGSEFRDTRLQAFRDKYMADNTTFGDVKLTTLSKTGGAIAPAGSADMVLTFRNVHNWKFSDFADKAFMDFYVALKPGGILGVVEHRLPEDRDIAEEESSGYIKASSVIAMAEAAGFELVGQSEVNANPADTADHPFGVWTLPPSSRTKSREGDAPEGFDPEKYKSIGESDRMTLKFRKPVDADGALLE